MPDVPPYVPMPRQLARGVSRQWPLVAGLGVIGAVLGLALGQTGSDEFRAEAVLLMHRDTVEEILDQSIGNKVDSTPTIAREIREFVDAQDLGSSAGATVDVDPNVLTATIRVDSDDRELAVEAANALAREYVDANRQRGELAARDALEVLNPRLVELDSQIAQIAASGGERVEALIERRLVVSRAIERIEVGQRLDRLGSVQLASAASEAEPVGRSSIPAPRTVVALGVLGVILGGAVSAARVVTNPTIHHSSEVEPALGLGVLGEIDLRGAAPGPLLSHLTQPTFGQADRVAAARTRLLPSFEAGRLTSIAVVAVGDDVAAAEWAAGLATVVARAGRRVTVVDGDVRAPVLHEVFGTPLAPGLTEIASGGVDAAAASHAASTVEVAVVPAGKSADVMPADVFSLAVVSEALEKYRDESDLLVISAASVSRTSESMSAALRADAVLLVAELHRSGVKELRQARLDFEALDRHLLGVLLVRRKR